MPGTPRPVPFALDPSRHRAGRRRIAILLLTVLIGGQGCYSYHPTTLPSLAVGEQIRVALGQDEVARLLPGSGDAGPRRLEGRFSGFTADSLVMSVWTGQGQEGTPLAASHQDVFIPREHVALVETRAFSGKRTALLVTGIVAAAVVLFNSVGFVDIFGSGDAGTPPPPGPSPAPIFR